MTFYKLTDTRYEAPIFTFPINWDLLSMSPIEVGDHIIRSVKQRLNDQGATDEPEMLYPKILTPNEYRDKIDRLKRALNAMYGRGIAGNHAYGICNELRNKPLYTLDEVEHLIKARSSNTVPKIEDVIFNDPATIVFWKDGTKTVVKAQDGEEYDPEKGLAMAISKKAMGNTRDYYLTFKKYLKKYADPYTEYLMQYTAKLDESVDEEPHQISLEETANKYEGVRIPMKPLYGIVSDETLYTCPVCGNTRYEKGNTVDKYSWLCNCRNRSAHRNEYPCDK